MPKAMHYCLDPRKAPEKRTAYQQIQRTSQGVQLSAETQQSAVFAVAVRAGKVAVLNPLTCSVVSCNGQACNKTGSKQSKNCVNQWRTDYVTDLEGILTQLGKNEAPEIALS
jgi:dihydroxyacetone kinase-like predicted kinase